MRDDEVAPPRAAGDTTTPKMPQSIAGYGK
jgi:hypothetical protein